MLNTIIPPEIKDDEFYDALKRYAIRSDLKTFLEIGSSGGQGSTDAFVSSIRQRPDRDDVRMFCMEVSKERFSLLANTYEQDHFVKCRNFSSVSLSEFPTEPEVIQFYTNVPTNLNGASLPVVLSWLKQDISYVRSCSFDFNGIEKIKKEDNIDFFDMVLIDGSEFTGEREFYSIAGARVIALDDINTLKCYNVHHMLKNNTSYKLVSEDMSCRNGFSFFERKF